MTNKSWWAAVLVAFMVVLGGCKSGGNAQNSTQLRALNAVADAEPLDVLVEDDVKFAAVPLGTTTATSEFESGTRDLKIRSSTNGAILTQKSVNFGDGARNTLVLYGKRGALGTQLLVDSTATPSGGKFRMRAIGFSGESGAVDLYITAGSPVDSSATLSSVAYLTATDYSELNAGSFKIYMTVAGTKDVIFQSAAQTFAEGSNVSILVFPSAGGKLVNAVLLREGQDGGGTLLDNPVGRVKAVNAIPTSPPLNFKADGTTLLAGVPFTGTSSYVTLTSGTRTLQLEASNVPGSIIASASQAIGGARDYTIVALDTLAAPRLAVLADDNTLPNAGFAKVRFVNAQMGSTTVDALVNFAVQSSGIAYGTASGYNQISAATDYTVSFTTAGGVTTIATLAPVQFDAGGIYTAYLFGTSATPQVKVARDR